MRRAEALNRLRQARPRWESMGVARLQLFGSVARDEAGPASDVDLLVEFKDPVGLLELFALRRTFEDILGTRVDLGTPQSLRPEFRDDVLAEAVHVA